MSGCSIWHGKSTGPYIIFSAGELVGIAVGGASNRGRAERLVRVARSDRAVVLGDQTDRRAQRITEESEHGSGSRPAEVLVNPQPG